MNMSIYEKVIAFYRAQGRDENLFLGDVAYYLKRGYVFCTRDCILMGERIGTGWFVYLAVGEGAMEYFLRHLPYPLPHIGWQRREGKVRWYPLATLTKKLMKENYVEHQQN